MLTPAAQVAAMRQIFYGLINLANALTGRGEKHSITSAAARLVFH
jgi:hypothetical protein